MNSDIASLADNSFIEKEESSPPDTYRAPRSAPFIWILTFDASHWVHQFFVTVTIPISLDYVYRKTIQTGGGFGILRPHAFPLEPLRAKIAAWARTPGSQGNIYLVKVSVFTRILGISYNKYSYQRELFFIIESIYYHHATRHPPRCLVERAASLCSTLLLLFPQLLLYDIESGHLLDLLIHHSEWQPRSKPR